MWPAPAWCKGGGPQSSRTNSAPQAHSAAGELTIAFEVLEMAAEPGLTLTIYTAAPGSPSEEGLRLLASWAATQNSDSPSTTKNAGR
ncbi:hypothetical protein AB0I16_17680 [Streptomyces sp. NPDC050703]|uniref:MmyB family transcriptional regulator n=1 Tax=Streptomyces sp. NPDC050703 TaxID=3157218 RepID=UPI003445670A